MMLDINVFYTPICLFWQWDSDASLIIVVNLNWSRFIYFEICKQNLSLNCAVGTLGTTRLRPIQSLRVDELILQQRMSTAATISGLVVVARYSIFPITYLYLWLLGKSSLNFLCLRKPVPIDVGTGLASCIPRFSTENLLPLTEENSHLLLYLYP